MFGAIYGDVLGSYYEVHCTTDFSKIMQEFTEFEPHLVLMDVKLPFIMAIIGVVRFERFQRFQ